MRPDAPQLYQITTSFACFGLEVAHGRVAAVAPIAGWCRGKDAAWTLAYWRQRGALVRVVE